MINPNGKLTIARQCELLKISRGSYYYKPVQLAAEKVEYEETLMNCIDHIHTDYPWAGTRKIKQILLDDYGFKVGRKLVRRLMDQMGIQAIYPKINLSKRNFKESVVPYKLRGKNIFLPNQVWAVDITYIHYNHSHMYLTAIIDWYSRKIVGYNLADTLETENVIKAMKEAIDAYGVPCICNSDQGSQFTSDIYKEFLKSYNIEQSMGGKSRWADNVMIERWFRSLKTEEIYINEYNSPRELREGIKNYIYKYNHMRPHQALDYRTPDAVFSGVFSAALPVAAA